MKRLASASVLAFVFVMPSVARAELEQDNQVMFGVMSAYVPAQNNLPDDLAAIGTYASYSHSLDIAYLGVRIAFLYAWFPDGATGQQYVIEPDVFIGLQLKLGKSFALRPEVGTGALVNGGEGFAMAVFNHTYVRVALQLAIMKSVTLEAFAGPSFVIGPYVAGVFPEMGLGAGFHF